jgi:DNA-binding GntR family transcriptional regulator
LSGPSSDKTGLAVEVYDQLANALMSGALTPGTRLKIRDLADQMGVSVTPVRDAVLRLVNNGGLLFQSPRDIRVPLLERSRYLEIRAIRLELEGLAAERAAQFATTKDILFLESLLRENETALAAGDHLQGLRMNQRFHFALPEIGGMQILRALLESLWLQMGPLISSGYREGGRVMIDHHYTVVEAIRTANGPAARAAIREDILAGGEVLLLRGALAAPTPAYRNNTKTGKGSIADSSAG